MFLLEVKERWKGYPTGEPKLEDLNITERLNRILE